MKFKKKQLLYWRTWDGQLVRVQVITPGYLRTLVMYYESWDHLDEPVRRAGYKWNHRMWVIE